MIHAFIENAVAGNDNFCKEIVVGYAHTERISRKDVLAYISVATMDINGISSKDYRELKKTIVRLIKWAS